MKEANTKLQQKIEALEKSVDDSEQYGRRLCLRIKGLKKSPNETSDMVLESVKDLIKETNVSIPDEVLDRAHRISSKNDTVIVRFTSFRFRTLFYRSRQKLNKPISVHLDLSK